ncbi:MAG: TonB-dependent receptor [Desulfovibrionaceae bacterium]
MKRLVVMFFMAALCLPIQNRLVFIAAAADASSTQMEDMVVTATRTEEPAKEFPGRVEVITREQIKEMPVQTVDEALSYLSGVHQERTSGTNSFSSTVSLRGFGNDQGRTLVLLDGVPLNTADTGSVNWNRLNLEDIQRIEILKGPAAALYGSFAMGGVINIISVKPTKRFEGSTSASYGTNEDWKLRGVAAGRSSDDPSAVYARVSGLYHTNQGYKLPPPEQWSKTTRKTFLDEETISTKLGWDLSENANLEMQYIKDWQTEGEGSKIWAGTSRGYQTDSWQTRFNGNWEGWKSMINAYYVNINYYRTNEGGLLPKRGYDAYRTNVDRKNYGILTNLSRTFGPHTLTVGVDLTAGEMDGTDYYKTISYFATDAGKIWTIGPFIQDQMRFFNDKLIIVAGLRYDNATTYEGFTNSNIPAMVGQNRHLPSKTWDALSPRGSIKYFFLDNLSAYFSYGHAFRAPSLDSMYRTGSKKNGLLQYANPNLGPETSDTLEVGTDYQPMPNLRLSASGYHTIAKDFQNSVTVDAAGNTQVKNIGEVQIWGAEFGAEYDPFTFQENDLLKKFTLFANYTLNESKITQFPGNTQYVGKYLTNTPFNSFNVGYNWINKYLNSRVGVQYVGVMFNDSANTSTQTIDPHALVNAKVWRNLDFLGAYGQNVNVSFSVENLFDTRYVNTYGKSYETLNEGRTMYLELSCKF